MTVSCCFLGRDVMWIRGLQRGPISYWCYLISANTFVPVFSLGMARLPKFSSESTNLLVLNMPSNRSTAPK